MARSGSPCSRAGADGRPRLLLDHGPLVLQALDVAAQLLVGRALGGRAHDHAGAIRHDLLEDLLQPRPLGVRQLARDPGHAATGHVHQVPPGKGHLGGEPGTLVAEGLLGDLDQHRVAGLQRLLDPAGLTFQAGRVPVHLTRVQHGVAALADVDEGGLHAGQHVLHPAQVDVAGHRRAAVLRRP